MNEHRKVIDEILKRTGAAEPRGIEDLIFNQPVSCNVEAVDLIDLATYGGTNFAAAVLAFRDSPSNRAWRALLTASLAYQVVCQFKAPRHEFIDGVKSHQGGQGAARSIAKGAAEAWVLVAK